MTRNQDHNFHNDPKLLKKHTFTLKVFYFKKIKLPLLFSAASGFDKMHILILLHLFAVVQK